MQWFALVMLFLIYLLWERRRLNRAIKDTKTRLEQVEELLLEVCALVESLEADSRTRATTVSESENDPKREPLSPLTETEEDADGSVDVERGKDRGTPPKTKEIAQSTGDGSFLFNESNRLGPILSLEKSKVSEGTPGKSKSPNLNSSIDRRARASNSRQDMRVEVKGGTDNKSAKSHLNKEQELIRDNITKTADHNNKSSQNDKSVRSDNRQAETVTPGSIPDRNRTLIDLCKNGTPIKEIARQVGMGQGEVQLIIDLYSKNN